MILKRLRLLIALIAACLLPFAGAETGRASSLPPSQSAEAIRAGLLQAQLDLATQPDASAAAVREAATAYRATLADVLGASAPEAHARVLDGLDTLGAGPAQGSAAAFAAARAQVWTAILAGGYTTMEAALRRRDVPAAREWLPVREFRTATRFARPNADATLAVEGAIRGSLAPDDAILALRADLLDTYQARLAETIRALSVANASGFPARRAELAALAEGYFHILAPAYAEQRGEPALAEATAAFADLRAAAVANPAALPARLASVEATLKGFRAAPLSAAEQSRRAGQLLRFLSLVPVEYGRGIADGRVTRALEIQEALTFHAGANAAFSDLEHLLAARDPALTADADRRFATLGGQLSAAGAGGPVADPGAIQTQANALIGALKSLIPEAWLAGSAQGDFDVIEAMLDQMETAVRGGDYTLAESARLDAYAVMETGPEARLIVFAPHLKLKLEELFWNGQGENKGLAYLIQRGAALRDIKASRGALDGALAEAQTILGASSAPTSIAANAGLIVFREGLEAVLILASLVSSMKRAAERKYRRPIWLGALAALLATALTWLLAHEVLQSLARYGEKLEAVVSLIAIGVLLLITNWFFHKVYWTDWIASFHSRKRQLLSGEAGLWLGLAILGFTSVYREGFETVLFLQALVLDGGALVVLVGVVVALLAVGLVGLVTFRLQVNLPYKRMLIVTGILIGVVLLQMVGNTTHLLQVVGWLPIHVIEWLPLPYWLGTWFGLYATWESVSLQALAAVFVLGSYYLAEHAKDRGTRGKGTDSRPPAATRVGG